QATLAVLEPASTATRSYRQELTGLGLATVAGLGMALGLVGLSAVRDDRFYSTAEITEQVEADLVGQIPDLTALKIPGVPPLLGEADARHWYAESYRSLRSALRFYGPQEPRPQVVLITSAVSAEGKSTIATNLARVLAQGGSRVLLVDGDLRRGRLHELVSLKRDRGLADLLQEPGEWNRAFQSNSLPNWTFLSRGRDLPNPGDLLLSPRWDQLLVRLREHYDYVLIDSSPIFVADDATTLAPKVDGTLFVVRNRFSSARAVREALDLLYQRQARVLGLVLNRVEASTRSYYEYNNTADGQSHQAPQPAAKSEQEKAED
ncbi:MAG TPA: CpsD/CapB family tyrosine-protein kinase, partial [Candidatus Sulfotelmatobacter sp.]|nr:CpsD/CapB family tyrosine-protein kinase [Candidatus Sulfotelmatobacter sp.]